MKTITALFFLAISFSALAADGVQPNVVNFQGLGWTELKGGYPKESYELGDICWKLPTSTKEKHFRFPTKNELLAVLKANKLSISGQPSEYGIWTGTKEQFTFNDGSAGPKLVRCTRDGRCDNNPYEPGATSSRSVSIEADVVCVIELGAKSSSKEAKSATPAAQDGKKSSTGKTPALMLTQQSSSASDAATAKAAVDLKKKKDQDNKNALAAAKKQKEEAKAKAKADKEAALKAEGRVVKQTISGDSLEEHQAKTWCERRVPEFQKSMASSRNKLISMGSCSCRPGGAAVALSKQFRCEFAVSFREFSSNAR